jgi:hypothetical protein
VPESAEILAEVEHGYVRITDMPAILGVTYQRCAQLAEREDFPAPAKATGRRRLWRRVDVERMV